MIQDRAAVALAFGADAFAGTKTSKVVDRGLYGRRLRWVIVHKGGAGSGRYTVTMETCLGDGSTPTAIPFRYYLAAAGDDVFAAAVEVAATGFTVPADTDQTIVLEAYPDEDPNSALPGIRVKTVETVDDPILGGILVYCADPVQCGASVESMFLA